jgi:hypothetical protein
MLATDEQHSYIPEARDVFSDIQVLSQLLGEAELVGYYYREWWQIFGSRPAHWVTTGTQGLRRAIDRSDRFYERFYIFTNRWHCCFCVQKVATDSVCR